MPNKEEADKAIAGMNGKDLKGRNLTVNEARPRTDRPRTGGGFGGGRGGRQRAAALAAAAAAAGASKSPV